MSAERWYINNAYQSGPSGFLDTEEHGPQLRQPVAVHGSHTLHVLLQGGRGRGGGGPLQTQAMYVTYKQMYSHVQSTDLAKEKGKRSSQEKHKSQL